jgi:hypothetical protein
MNRRYRAHRSASLSPAARAWQKHKVHDRLAKATAEARPPNHDNSVPLGNNKSCTRHVGGADLDHGRFALRANEGLVIQQHMVTCVTTTHVGHHRCVARGALNQRTGSRRSGAGSGVRGFVRARTGECVILFPWVRAANRGVWMVPGACVPDSDTPSVVAAPGGSASGKVPAGDPTSSGNWPSRDLRGVAMRRARGSLSPDPNDPCAARGLDAPSLPSAPACGLWVPAGSEEPTGPGSGSGT